jgi:hypothetical protein
MTMAKVTLSVPDDLYARIDVHKDQLNLSEIFRVCVSEEIEKLEGKPNAEITMKLKDYLRAKSPLEVARKAEIDRFTKKWGPPDIINPDDANYVRIMKNQPITIGNITLELKIFNRLASPLGVRPFIQEDFNLEKWSFVAQGKLDQVADFFKSVGFRVGEYYNADESKWGSGGNYGLVPALLEGLLAEEEAKKATEEIMQREFRYFGLFADDREDIVFIAYRKEKAPPLRF